MAARRAVSQCSDPAIPKTIVPGYTVYRREIKLTHQRDEITLQEAQLILPRAEVGEESPGEGCISPTSNADPGANAAVAGRGRRHGSRPGWSLWNLWKPEAL